MARIEGLGNWACQCAQLSRARPCESRGRVRQRELLAGARPCELRGRARQYEQLARARPCVLRGRARPL